MNAPFFPLFCFIFAVFGFGNTSSGAAEAADAITTPNAFLQRGTPTFVAGSLGDARTSASVLAQIRSIRDPLFPRAAIVEDTSVELAKGVAGWPSQPVVYGGSHVNRLIQQLSDRLGLSVGPGKLRVGGAEFEGTAYRLIAVVPAQAATAAGPAFPEFLLYAGTGTPGVTGINATPHGRDPILIADEFGSLVAGTWRAKPDGTYEPVLGRLGRRIAWRTLEKNARTATGASVSIRVRYPESLPLPSTADEVAMACARGLTHVAAKLGVAPPDAITVYVYPDRGSKRSLTGDAGDGRADVPSRSIHIVTGDAGENGPVERMIGHEGTHVMLDRPWGTAGSEAIGEGIAVWASGGYGGIALEAWPARLTGELPPVATLLGPNFRRMPEPAAYPVAGLLVEEAIRLVGLAQFRDHLYPATAANWDAACRIAGTSTAALDTALRQRLAHPTPQ